MSRLLTLLASAVVALPAHAQITITQSMVNAALSTGGTTTVYSTESSAALTALAAQTGANQTWDFVTGLTYDAGVGGTVTPVSPPVPGSDDPHLAQATHILRVTYDDSTAYTFELLSGTAETFLGVAADTLVVRSVPGKTILALPTTFGSTWTSTYEVQIVPTVPGFTTTVEDVSTVVGWGTLVTPAGSTAALMIRTETTTTLSFPPLPPIVTTSADVAFTGYGTINANIYIPSTGPMSGDYNLYQPGTATGPGPTATALRLDVEGANPMAVGQAVPLAYTLVAPAAARIEVFDALGRRVGTALDGPARPAGTHRVVWAAPPLAPGVYLARLTAGGGVATRAFTVAR